MRQKENTTEEEIPVKENQSLIIAQINIINGNEITFSEAKEMDMSAGNGNGMGGTTENSSGNARGNGDSSGLGQDNKKKIHLQKI